MGGIVISTAAEQRPEKIARLVYVAAYMLPDGHSLAVAALGDPLAHGGRSYTVTGPEASSPREQVAILAGCWTGRCGPRR